MSLANKTAMASVGNQGWGPGSTSQRATVMRAGMRGDPGIFGDIWGGIKGAATGLLTGGPLGAIGGALSGSGLISRDPKPPALPGLGTIGIAGMPGTIMLNPRQGTTTTTKVNLSPLPGNIYERTTYQNGGMKPPSGYHYNKSDYFLRDGTFVPAGTKLVKNRRRNPANSRATNRAISRVASAKKHAKDLGRITIREKKSCR
jgi:hypothetical protein